MATITIMDPVTRIEGHLKVEVTIDQAGGRQVITDARCTGTLFRGFENILKGRDPWDAPLITQRICGVCPVSHSLAAVMAIDAASGNRPPANGRILRNLTLGANYLQSHILHFYLLAALDYVAAPASAPWNSAWDVDLRGGLDGVAGHLPLAVEARRRAHEMGAIFGGRMPLPPSIVPGGHTAVPTAERIGAFRTQLAWLSDFIRNVYLPDVEAVGQVYADYFSLGKGWGNLLAFGAFEQNDSGSARLFKRGHLKRGAASGLRTNLITESVTSSWYDQADDNLKPLNGRTNASYPRDGAAYSWLKSPRYNGRPVETGPLARMAVSGFYGGGVSVMDRHLARALEAVKVAEAMDGWLDELRPGRPSHRAAAPPQGPGAGLTEAPRGALGHWLRVSSGRIASYQVITPTCWNASPKDGLGRPGPMEKALIGIPVADASRPVEALRVIHSFDPCLSCAVHVMRPGGKAVVVRPRGR